MAIHSVFASSTRFMVTAGMEQIAGASIPEYQAVGDTHGGRKATLIQRLPARCILGPYNGYQPDYTWTVSSNTTATSLMHQIYLRPDIFRPPRYSKIPQHTTKRQFFCTLCDLWDLSYGLQVCSDAGAQLDALVTPLVVSSVFENSAAYDETTIFLHTIWSLRFVLWPPSLLGCGGRLIISKQLQ